MSATHRDHHRDHPEAYRHLFGCFVYYMMAINHVSVFLLSWMIRCQVQKLQQVLILALRRLLDATRGRCSSSSLPCRVEVWERGSENLQSWVTLMPVCKSWVKYEGLWFVVSVWTRHQECDPTRTQRLRISPFIFDLWWEKWLSGVSLIQGTSNRRQTSKW